MAAIEALRVCGLPNTIFLFGLKHLFISECTGGCSVLFQGKNELSHSL